MSGDAATKERLAIEMVKRGVTVTNPELADFCSGARSQIDELRVALATEPLVAVQPAAPARPKLGLAGWRQKKQPAPEPVKSAAETPVQAEPTSHQIDTAPSALIPTADELETAAQKASLGDVDGVLSYRTRIDAYKLAELVTSDQKMRDYYRALLDADENGYPWRQPAREALQSLEREIQSGNLDNADERLTGATMV